MSYTKSNVTTYEQDHLDIVHVKLPLKYPDLSHPQEELSPKDQFTNSVAKSGNLLYFNNTSIIISNTLVQDNKTIKLTPIVNNSNSLGLKYHQIHVTLPNNILVYSITKNEDEDNKTQIIVDIIDENFLFINIIVDLNDFLTGSTFSLDKFDSWCHISIPYSFELTNSIPCYMSHLSNTNLIVALSNGQLIEFSRRGNLTDLTVKTQFVEHTTFTLFGLFSNKTIKEINGISRDLVIDSVLVDNDYLVTLTISKYLKIWNLTNGQLLNSIYIGGNEDNWLTLIPNKCLQLLQFNNSKYITLFINDEESYKFKLYDLENLTELSQFQFSIDNELNWFIQDYIVEQQDLVLKYHILFKSNVYSNLSTYNISIETGAVTQIFKSESNSNLSTEFEEVSPYHSSEYYINKIFNSELYNQLIINTSLYLLRPHLKTPINDNSKQSIIKALDNQVQIWFKFDSLCQEFLKLSQESIAIGLYNDSILSLQVNSFGIFHPSHYYQLQEQFAPLEEIFNKFNQIISQKSFYKLHQQLLTTEEISQDELFQTFISGKLSEDEIQEIISKLDSIPDIVYIIESITKTTSFELLIVEERFKQLSSFVKLEIISTFQSIKSSHELLLINLIILFTICQTNDEITSMINTSVRLLKSYNLLELVLTNKFNNSESLFWNIVSRYPNLTNLLNSHKLNDSFDYLLYMMSEHQFVTDVMIELINSNQYEFLYTHIISKLNGDDFMVDRFFIGIIHLLNFHPEEVYQTFKDFNSVKQLDRYFINDKFDELTRTIYNNNVSEYYHILAELCQEQTNKDTATQFIEIALKFEMLAIENDTTNPSYYINIFNMALSISNYELVEYALEHIESDITPYLTKLISQLISTRNISIIFSKNSIYITRFKLIDSILLTMANQENDDMMKALKLYEYLYSWRLIGISNTQVGDKRGAIESLYTFIIKFKDSIIDSKWKLKFLEIYMIILNILKGLDKDEQWLLNQVGTRKVVSGDDIKVEYLGWLKQLEYDTEMVQM
ncbi:hypothetical protein JA1_002624 [Spathaspora sp. JA1]|nr:hypothetical protein JA1_002624 [Spathaspora sp. JA1]